jgi:hypothetical protein
MFQHWFLRTDFLVKIFLSEATEVKAICRIFHDETSHKFNPSSDVIIIIKLRKMKWEGHVAGIPETKCLNYCGGRIEGITQCGMPMSILVPKQKNLAILNVPL